MTHPADRPVGLLEWAMRWTWMAALLGLVVLLATCQPAKAAQPKAKRPATVDEIQARTAGIAIVVTAVAAMIATGDDDPASPIHPPHPPHPDHPLHPDAPRGLPSHGRR